MPQAEIGTNVEGKKRSWKCRCLRAKTKPHVAGFGARQGMAELVLQE